MYALFYHQALSVIVYIRLHHGDLFSFAVFSQFWFLLLFLDFLYSFIFSFYFPSAPFLPFLSFPSFLPFFFPSFLRLLPLLFSFFYFLHTNPFLSLFLHLSEAERLLREKRTIPLEFQMFKTRAVFSADKEREKNSWIPYLISFFYLHYGWFYGGARHVCELVCGGGDLL